jgi:hypothetical protein
MIYLLDFRSADTGGAVVPGVVVRMPGLGAEHDLRGETRITFLVHGYNVNRQRGRESLLRLAGKLPAVTDTALVGILWPGDHWSRAASYPFEGRDADDSAAALARYIGDVIPRGSQLSFVSHSLGARVVMETVRRLNTAAYGVLQVALLAPAVDDFSLAHPSTYLHAVAKTERVAVLASRKDIVLKLAYPAGDLLQAFFFFRTDQAGLALGYHGPRKSKTHAVPAKVYHVQIPDARGVNHGHYFPDEPATANQSSAVGFAGDVLQGAPRPEYR